MRTLSTDMLRALNEQDSEQAILNLITIEHPTLSEPIRVTSDGVQTEREIDGETGVYQPAGFRYEFPEEGEDTMGEAQLTIENVSGEILEAIDGIEERAVVTSQFVLASNPQNIEVEWPDFELLATRYDALRIRGTLIQENFEQEPYPKDQMDPSNLPGIF